MESSSIRKSAARYARILLGSAIFAFGFRYITYPNAIVTGGVSGVAMTVNLLTGFPVGLLIIILNVPLFLLAWRQFGLGYLAASAAGMLASSLLVDLFSFFPLAVTGEVLLASVYGGLVQGFGLGLVLSAGASTGGVEIAAKLIRKRRPDLNYGTVLLIIDAVVITSFALIFKKYDSAMYAIISIYIGSVVIDLVLTGGVNSKVCYIISDNSDQIKDAIHAQLDRGVTLLYGAGGYSRQEKNVILCVIKRQQIVSLKQILRDLDPKAFMIVSDSREVFGDGFSSIFE